MAKLGFLGYSLCLTFFWICGINCQEYVVPVYVRADQYGTDHFLIPRPKFGPHKSSFHIEQLIRLENELLGLSGLILETEAKLHARKKLQKAKDERPDKLKDGAEKHVHNYTLETRFLEDVNEQNEKALKNMKSFVNNPLAMFSIRKRLADTWPYVMDNITECSMVSEHVAISNHFESVTRKLKEDGDLEMAYEDILRLQKAYNLPVSSLARGWILDEITEPLGLSDIIEIANICLNREDLKGALEWLLQISKLLKTMGLQGKLKVKYMNILGGAYLRLNRLQEAKLVYGQLIKEDPDSRIANANMRLIEEKMKTEAAKEQKAKVEDPKKKSKKGKTSKGKSVDEKKDKKEEGYKEEWWLKYCRGDLPPYYERETMLKSYIKEIPISGKKYKVTPLSLYPPVILIKEVLENFTISKLINFATEEIVEKIHTYSQPDEASAPVFWNDETYWMEKFTVTMRNLTYQKYSVESHAKLNLLGAVRVYNVGAGGTSNPGRGELKVTPRSTWEKNYIGRYVLFLKPPKAGGHFAFPWLRVSVKPEKGDILFWQFRTPTGKVHPRVQHWLECPVILGDFWYAEQMIEHNNMIDKVDLSYIPEVIKKSDNGSKKKKILKKKKKVVKKEEEEEEEEEEDEAPVEEPEEDEEEVEEDVEMDEEEAEVEEDEEKKEVPKKKVVKKTVSKTKDKMKEPKEKKHPKEARSKSEEKEVKAKMADKEKPATKATKEAKGKPDEKKKEDMKVEKEKVVVKKKKVKKTKTKKKAVKK